MTFAAVFVIGHAAVAEAAKSIGRVTIVASGSAQYPLYEGLLGSERLVVTTTAGATSQVSFHDLGGGLILSTEDGCSGSGSSTVRCAITWGPAHPGVSVSAGLGNDTIDVRGWPLLGGTQVFGDLGDDVVLGGDASDAFYGGAGADILRGGGGDDFLVAGQGADRLYGEAGSDALLDGDGTLRQDLDRFDCGDGLDSAFWRPNDIVVNCERRYP